MGIGPAQSRWIAAFAAGFVMLYPQSSRFDAIKLARRVQRLHPVWEPAEALQALMPSRARHRELVAASRQALDQTAAGRMPHLATMRRSKLAVIESRRMLDANQAAREPDAG